MHRARNRWFPDSSLEGTGFEPSVPLANGTAMGGPPKSILAISDLTLGGSTDRADVPIGNAQQSLLQQRDRWFESGSLQRGVCELSVPKPPSKQQLVVAKVSSEGLPLDAARITLTLRAVSALRSALAG